MSHSNNRPKQRNIISSSYQKIIEYYDRFSTWHSKLRILEVISFDMVIGGLLLLIVPLVGLSFYYFDIVKAWEYIARHVDPVVWIFVITYVISVIVYLEWKLLFNFHNKEGIRRLLLIIFAVIISCIFWITAINQTFTAMNIQLPPFITPTLTFTPTLTKIPSLTPTSTPTRTPTNTITSTPTSIYDPVIDIIVNYYNHITNNRTNTVDYDIAWSILSETFRDVFKSCPTCKNAKERWIWVIRQYYWNINPEELGNSGSIIIHGSYAKADYHLEKIQIEGNIQVYDNPISMCLVKENNGWKISFMPNGVLSSIDDCMIYK